jgi:cytochrome c oxidase subunit 4
MSHTKLYTIIFGVLFVFATVQALIEQFISFEQSYWLAFGMIMLLSVIKALLVAGYYQHLRWEPRSVSYLAGGGLLVALALTAAAAYSIV